MIATTDTTPLILPSGKFLSRAGNKFFLKAVRLQTAGSKPGFEQTIALHSRLKDLKAAHTTAVVISDTEAEALLELVAQPGLYALVEIRLKPEDLYSRGGLRAAIADLRKRMRILRGIRSVVGYLLDYPVDADTVRLHGIERLRSRLGRIIGTIREIDAGKLVAVKHHSSSIGLTLREEDFVYAVMPPLAPGQLRSSVIHLHNLAEARPVVLEFAEPSPEQDELVAYAFGLGAAGVVVAAGPDPDLPKPFAHGSLALKMLRASDMLPFLTLNGTCPPKLSWTPKVSVVICAYNAERTMRQCLESLRRIDYPDFEVIVVDDGSRDETAQIAGDFPEFRLIRQPNKGLSIARNVGLHAALGELIAYTDSDCVVDPHWLTFIVRAIAEGGLDGCGGPNYSPHEEGWVEGCVAASPGAPCHVLTGDDRAEHLAGCNMVFRKTALVDVGGFDPQFSSAGDDVDICWRLLDQGRVLGYCPAAFVWHFRRNTVKAYYGQQRGYGKAEAMLYLKYPARFNALGQIKWNGTLPGLARTVPGKGRVRVRWSASAKEFQHVDEMPLSVLSVAPLTAEWTVAAAVLVVLSLLLGFPIAPALAAMAAGPLWGAYYALRAPLEKCHSGLASRCVIGWLAYSGSIVRALARYHWRIDARKQGLLDREARQKPLIDWSRRSIRLSYWSGNYTARETVLEHLHKFFAALGRPVLAASEWEDFDLVVKPNPWTRIQFKTADEELGGLELKTNVAARLRLSTGARLGLGACATAVAGAFLLGPSFAALVLCVAAACVAITAISGLGEGGSFAYYAVEQCANKLGLVPLGKPARPVALPSVQPAREPERPAEAAQPAGR